MSELVICRGLPASGKTTLAQAWVAEDPERRARVNRDDLRDMLHRGHVNAAVEHRQVTAARDALIKTLLERGISVVSDDTNLSQRVARDIARIGRHAGAQVAVWDLTDVALEECLLRDQLRSRGGGRFVGERAIREKHQRYLAGRKHPLPFPEDPPDFADEVVPYVPPADAPKAVLVDVDGTCAIHQGRSPYDETRVHEDHPNPAVIAAVEAMAAAGCYPVFCSGRTAACRGATEEWLEAHMPAACGGGRYELWMRAEGDTRNDAVVKLELFDRHVRDRFDVVCVFDDRQRVVDMWRSLGLTVFQVAPGDF